MRWVFLLAAFGVACNEPPPLDQDEIAAGHALFRSNGCAVCHGLEGRGDGVLARNFDPPPRDFRDRNAYREGRTERAITRTLAEGILTRGKGMHGYPHIPESDRKKMAAYVVSLQGKD